MTMTKQEISKLLYRHDPMGLARIGAPSDEYDSEAEDIAKQLRALSFENEIQELVHQVFVKWFDNDNPKVMLAGPIEKYAEIAREIHQDLQMDINLMFYWLECDILSGGFERQPLFGKILEYGNAIVPKLLKNIDEHGFACLAALSVIAGDTRPEFPIGNEGKLEPLRDLWMIWGKEHGYV